MVTQMAAQTAAVESELNTWQNATIHILKRFLLENPGKEIEICYKHWCMVVVLGDSFTHSSPAGDCSGQAGDYQFQNGAATRQDQYAA